MASGYYVPGYGVVGASEDKDTGRSTTQQGALRPKNGGSDDEVRFAFNPAQITRTRQPTYAEVGAAMQDYWRDYKGPSPLQWVRNPAEVISFELLLDSSGGNVPADIKKLEAMQSNADQGPGVSKEPPDLLFRYGARSATVRITSYRIVEELHDSELRVQRARVSLDLKCITPFR